MNEPNAIHPETQFQQSVSDTIESLRGILHKARQFRSTGKRSRRDFNWPQHHITVLTKTLQHRKSCIQGYRAKARLAKDGKGHNTTSGIPETFLELV